MLRLHDGIEEEKEEEERTIKVTRTTMNGFLGWLDRSCYQESRQHTNVDTDNGNNLLQHKSNYKRTTTTIMIIIVRITILSEPAST